MSKRKVIKKQSDKRISDEALKKVTGGLLATKPTTTTKTASDLEERLLR